MAAPGAIAYAGYEKRDTKTLLGERQADVDQDTVSSVINGSRTLIDNQSWSAPSVPMLEAVTARNKCKYDQSIWLIDQRLTSFQPFGYEHQRSGLLFIHGGVSQHVQRRQPDRLNPMF